MEVGLALPAKTGEPPRRLLLALSPSPTKTCFLAPCWERQTWGESHAGRVPCRSSPMQVVEAAQAFGGPGIGGSWVH